MRDTKAFFPLPLSFPFRPLPLSLSLSYCHFVLVTVTPKYRQISRRSFRSSFDFLEIVDESLSIPSLIVSDRVDRNRSTPEPPVKMERLERA